MTEQPFDALAAVLSHIDDRIIAHRDATQQAIHSAGADLQEARHQLRAAELGEDELSEATAIVRLRRAERKHAEAEQQNQQAQQAYGHAFVEAWRAVRDIEYPAAEAWRAAAQQRVITARAQADQLDQDLAQEFQRLIAARITPLQRIAENLKLPIAEFMPDHQGNFDVQRLPQRLPFE